MLRYRSGVDRHTGKVLTGWAHCAQSVDCILSTLKTERLMRLDFGARAIRVIGRAMTPRLLLELYRDMVIDVHAQEAEYRIRRLDVTSVGRTGSLAIKLRGLYYPEGRFGNYDDFEAAETLFPKILERAA